MASWLVGLSIAPDSLLIKKACIPRWLDLFVCNQFHCVSLSAGISISSLVVPYIPHCQNHIYSHHGVILLHTPHHHHHRRHHGGQKTRRSRIRLVDIVIDIRSYSKQQMPRNSVIPHCSPIILNPTSMDWTNTRNSTNTPFRIPMSSGETSPRISLPGTKSSPP